MCTYEFLTLGDSDDLIISSVVSDSSKVFSVKKNPSKVFLAVFTTLAMRTQSYSFIFDETSLLILLTPTEVQPLLIRDAAADSSSGAHHAAAANPTCRPSGQANY